jgi:hypothetical protein
VGLAEVVIGAGVDDAGAVSGQYCDQAMPYPTRLH